VREKRKKKKEKRKEERLSKSNIAEPENGVGITSRSNKTQKGHYYSSETYKD
jgi:hypothetical protein